MLCHVFQVALSLSVLHFFPVSPDLCCQQGQSTLKFLHYSCPSSLTDAWHCLSSQTGSLIRVRLLCGHVHQWCAGGQARWGEDGGGWPGCVVGPGAVRIHRYRNTYLFLLEKDQYMEPCSSLPLEEIPVCVHFYLQSHFLQIAPWGTKQVFWIELNKLTVVRLVKWLFKQYYSAVRCTVFQKSQLITALRCMLSVIVQDLVFYKKIDA